MSLTKRLDDLERVAAERAKPNAPAAAEVAATMRALSDEALHRIVALRKMINGCEIDPETALAAIRTIMAEARQS